MRTQILATYLYHGQRRLPCSRPTHGFASTRIMEILTQMDARGSSRYSSLHEQSTYSANANNNIKLEGQRAHACSMDVRQAIFGLGLDTQEVTERQSRSDR